MVAILISAAFRVAVHIRRQALIWGRNLLQCVYQKVQRLLEEIWYSLLWGYLIKFNWIRSIIEFKYHCYSISISDNSNSRIEYWKLNYQVLQLVLSKWYRKQRKKLIFTHVITHLPLVYVVYLLQKLVVDVFLKLVSVCGIYNAFKIQSNTLIKRDVSLLLLLLLVSFISWIWFSKSYLH